MEKNLQYITGDETRKLKLIMKSLIVGICTSIVTIIYRFSLIYAEKGSFYIYKFVKDNPRYIIILFILLALLGYIVGKIIEKEPYSSGSGIPQVKAFMGGYLKNRPIKTIINKIIGGSLSILSGLSLGREGPSVQLGACTGDYLSKKFKSSRFERRLLMSSGASAGLSAAFNAPLAGVIFSLEEIYKYFSPLVLISTIVAAVGSDFISKEVFGLNPVFSFNDCAPIPLNKYWVLVILGLLCGFFGAIYNKTIDICQKLYGKIKLKPSIRMIPVFWISGIIGLTIPTILCGGHRLLEEYTLSKGILILIVLVAFKFIFSIFSFGSGAPGGIFFPLLIIGSGIGAVFGSICIKYLNIDPIYFNNFIILAMAGYFTAIVKAPITGIILITEMTSSLSHLLSLTIVSILAYIVSYAMKTTPIYDDLLDNLLKKNNLEDYHVNSNKKIIINSVVHYGSKAENILIKDMGLPDDTLIVSINRGDKTILPKGNTLVKAGDTIMVITDLKNEWRTRNYIEDLTAIE